MTGSADVTGEVGFERGPEFGQVQAAVDAAELAIGFEHPSGAPAQRHGPVPPPLDVLRMLPADLDQRLDRIRGAKGPRQGRRHASRRMVSVSAMPSRSDAAAPGWVLSSSAA